MESNPETARLKKEVADAMQKAYRFAEKIMRPSGHWYGELRSNTTTTAEYVILYQALGMWDRLDRRPLSRHLLMEQNEDGSWGLAPSHPGDVSTTTETYLALKILGEDAKESQAMRRAQAWMKSPTGGIENVRVLTRVFLAMFGLLPWTSVPQLPAELILMPATSPINIYKMSSWARSTLVPLLVICHHQPVFPLPLSGKSNKDYLDELWHDPAQKNISYGRSMYDLLGDRDFHGCLFTAVDSILSKLGGLRRFNPLRNYAVQSCMHWIVEHQEATGDWAGIQPPMILGPIAYALEGYTLDSALIRRGLEALERFAWQDDDGKRIQASVSPVWDTILMCMALSDTGLEQDPAGSNASRMRRCGLNWLRQRQIFSNQGDWRIYRPRLTPGGFSFEYQNAWYPDVDDTAAAVIAFLKDDRMAVSSSHVLDAVQWILGMQCSNGGWAAFDVDNDKLFLNKIPFSDMDCLCDPATADIAGRVLEAFGLVLSAAFETGQHSEGPLSRMLPKIQEACRQGISFLQRSQEINGAWFGRWGVNYIYGTSNVLVGLAYHCFEVGVDSEPEETSDSSSPCVVGMIGAGIRFLRSIQNSDGGWGEELGTYCMTPVTEYNRAEVKQLCSAASTAVQTSWAIMAMMPYVGTDDASIRSGIKYLLQHQTIADTTSATTETVLDAGHSLGRDDLRCMIMEDSPQTIGLSWQGNKHSGTGFPNHFYLGYTLYSHHFPMMALGGYLQACKQEKSDTKARLSF